MHADGPDRAVRQLNIVGSSVNEGTDCRKFEKTEKMIGTKGYSSKNVSTFLCIYTQICKI